MNDNAIGDTAFRSKILKDRLLGANDAALSFVKDLDLPKPVEPGSTLAKIQSRLLSSKILSAQVATSVESLRFLVNPALKPQKDNSTRDDEDLQLQQGLQQPNGKKPSKDDGESLPTVADDSGWESGTVDTENDIAEDASSECGSSRSSGALSDLDPEAETGSDEDANGPSDEKSPVIRKSGGKVSSNKIKKAISESTFLPSLSVGFIQGSDDSDFDEAAEINAADKPRKNRRGQRARRQYGCFIIFFSYIHVLFIRIWEKKYGRHANHKRKEAEERAAAFAKKRENVRIPNAYNTQRRTLSGQESSNVRGANATRSKDDKPLHPSWEAKRKQKDKERGNIVPGQGKKIKF